MFVISARYSVAPLDFKDDECAHSAPPLKRGLLLGLDWRFRNTRGSGCAECGRDAAAEDEPHTWRGGRREIIGSKLAIS